MVFVSFHAGATYADDDIGANDTIEKTFTPDIPLADLLAPIELLSAPIMGEEINSNFPELDIKTEFKTYSFLSTDLPPPALN